MNKSVFALAVFGAFAGAASAQSSVTLYGRLDTTIVYTDFVDADGRFGLNGNAPIGGSRWGMRGSEDLGGGLKANFVLESGFASDTGAPGNSSKLFDRQAWVGLSSGSLGSLNFGRQETLTRTNDLGFADISGEGELTVVETVAAIPLFQNFGSRVDNSIKYVSPSFSGFQVQALVAFGEGVTARQQGLMASYSGGPVKLALSYEAYVDAPGVDDTWNKVVTFGGSYNFGFATLLASVQNTSDFGGNTALSTTIEDHSAVNVGVLVPYGAWQFRAQYTESEVEPFVGSDRELKKAGVSARYAMSKRTTLYAVYTTRGGDIGAGTATSVKTDEVAFGIGHNF